MYITMPSSTPPSTPGAGGEIEKHTTLPHTNLTDDLAGSSSQESADHGDARIDAIRQKKPVLRFLANLESRIDRFAKFEAMGVERVPEDKRRPPQILNVCM